MQQVPVDRLAAFCRDQPAVLLLDVREPWECALAPLAPIKAQGWLGQRGQRQQQCRQQRRSP